MLYSIEQAINNVTYGKIFGYDECCITFFHKRMLSDELFNPVERKLNGTGFICCPECDKKYSEKELITKINKNRKYNKEFDTNIGDIDDDYFFSFQNENSDDIFKTTKKVLEELKNINIISEN